MTILNVNDIKEFEDQPIEYNTEQELIDWLKWDLLQQALRKGKTKNSNNTITITDEEEKNYILNIGKKTTLPLKDDEKIKINYTFICKLFFINLNLNKKIQFILNFNNTIFLNSFYLSEYDFENVFYFQNVKLNNSLDIADCNFSDKVVFSNSEFCDINRIYKTTFNSTFSFNSVNINDNFVFNEVRFCSDCIFNGSNFDGNILFSNNTFDGCFDLYDTKILQKFKIKESNIKEINFFISKIDGELIIVNTTFNKYKNAYNIKFNGVYSNNNNSTINISNDENYNKINFVNIDFYNMDFKGNLKINNINLYKLNLKNALFNINFIDIKIIQLENSDTARILKNDAYQKGNIIKALEYQAEETRLHKEELKEQFKENKNLKTFGDILSIELSSLYSDNGQNWIKAFICTILFPSVFFTFSFAPYTITLFILIILCFAYPMFHNNNITKYMFCSFITYLIISFLYMFNDNSHLNFIKELFSFLTPTNFNQIVYNNENPSYIHSNNTSYIQLIFKGISYFIGKITFWYGSVQTVQAFRKFAKGA